jgi:hypothetical protein
VSRGVLYMTWRGEHDPTDILARSRTSVAHWHPELPVHVAEMPAESNLLCKQQMFDLSPFRETLFLDADTTVLGKLDYGFEQARNHGVACCISANPWQRRYERLEIPDDAVEYSSGVVFFSKDNSRVRGVFERWGRYTATCDSRCRYQADDGVREQPFNDQALFTLAMHDAGYNPFVLPLNWNLFPKWQKAFFGPVKVWHGYDDIPASLLAWNEEQSKRDTVIRCATLP